MQTCIFCKIVKGEIDSAKIFEDENVLAFLDIQPDTEGHCLVIPKKHFENIYDVEEQVLQNVIITGKRIAKKLKTSLQADGISLVNLNERGGGQGVFHFHLHVIPRYNNDGLNLGQKQGIIKDIKELKKLAERIDTRDN